MPHHRPQQGADPRLQAHHHRAGRDEGTCVAAKDVSWRRYGRARSPPAPRLSFVHPLATAPPLAVHLLLRPEQESAFLRRLAQGAQRRARHGLQAARHRGRGGRRGPRRQALPVHALEEHAAVRRQPPQDQKHHGSGGGGDDAGLDAYRGAPACHPSPSFFVRCCERPTTPYPPSFSQRCAERRGASLSPLAAQSPFPSPTHPPAEMIEKHGLTDSEAERGEK